MEGLLYSNWFVAVLIGIIYQSPRYNFNSTKYFQI